MVNENKLNPCLNLYSWFEFCELKLKIGSVNKDNVFGILSQINILTQNHSCYYIVFGRERCFRIYFTTLQQVFVIRRSLFFNLCKIFI